MLRDFYTFPVKLFMSSPPPTHPTPAGPGPWAHVPLDPRRPRARARHLWPLRPCIFTRKV